MMKMVPSPNQQIGSAGSDLVAVGPTSPGRNKSGGIKTSRSRGWLGGYGIGSPGSTPSSRRCSGISSPQRAAAIADDIRNDQELFFADDDEPPVPIMLPSSEAAGQNNYRPALDLNNSYRPALDPRPRRLSTSTMTTTSSSVGLVRRSSQQKMENLQREVDRALEYFSQETEDGLDDCFDDDHYLNRPAEKYQRVPDKVAPPYGRRPSSCNGGDECDSYGAPGTAATSMATSVVTDYDNEYSDCQFVKFLSLSDQSSPGDAETPRSSAEPSSTGLSLKHKTKSLLTLPKALIPSQTELNCAVEEEDATSQFESVISEELGKILCLSEERNGNHAVDFNSNPSLRSAMEPFLAVARIRREEARQDVFNTLDKIMMPQEPHAVATRRNSTSSEYSFPIGSSYGVPYPILRNESSFLYDVDSFPLDKVLAETLGVEDLSKLHLEHPLKKDKGRLLASLQNRSKRRKFHQCFDSFVTSQVIPLLHSQALSKGVFYTNRHQLQKGKPQSIVYRYQAFPSINIVRPGECSTDPHCDMAQGHSIGNISYHIPLTATFGTNAVYTESRPGREDWHPLVTKSPGLGFQFDGARCLHFNLKNETDITRVSLNFRIAIIRAPDYKGDAITFDMDDQLCCPELLKDDFSRENPGFYDEVVVNVGDVPRSFMPGPVAVKRRGISVVG